MKNNKASFKLIIILFAISLAVALPCSRSLKSISATLSSQDLQDQVAEGQFEEEAASFVVVRRMDIEVNDYAGTGANPNHDPKPPGTD